MRVQQVLVGGDQKQLLLHLSRQQLFADFTHLIGRRNPFNPRVIPRQLIGQSSRTCFIICLIINGLLGS
jgi:hypothetical protein